MIVRTLEEDDDNVVYVASGSGDWSIEVKLLNILTEAVKELGLDWFPSEQPVKNRLGMWFLQSGRCIAALPETSSVLPGGLGAPSIRTSPSHGTSFPFLCRWCRPLGILQTDTR